jgi:hypothetical protein
MQKFFASFFQKRRPLLLAMINPEIHPRDSGVEWPRRLSTTGVVL